MAGGGYGRGAGIPLKDRIRVDSASAAQPEPPNASRPSSTPATEGGDVSANPPKHDAWRPYDDIRFVLVHNTGRLKPSRGLVLDWKREGRRWEALVVWHDDAALKPVVKMDWLGTNQLIPVPVDPNWTGA